MEVEQVEPRAFVAVPTKSDQLEEHLGRKNVEEYLRVEFYVACPVGVAVQRENDDVEQDRQVDGPVEHPVADDRLADREAGVLASPQSDRLQQLVLDMTLRPIVVQ